MTDPRPVRATQKVKAPRAARGPMWPLLLAVLLVGAAVAAYMYPIPGLTQVPPDALGAANTAQAAQGQGATQAVNAQADKEAALAKQEADLKAREDSIKQQEAQVSALLTSLSAQQSILENLRQTATIMAAMPPYKAAPLMETLDAITAAQVLRMLDKGQAAAILTYMSTEKGAAITREFLKPSKP